MAVTKIRKMSSWTLLGVMIVSVIVFAMFYFGGVVKRKGAKNIEQLISIHYQK